MDDFTLKIVAGVIVAVFGSCFGLLIWFVQRYFTRIEEARKEDKAAEGKAFDEFKKDNNAAHEKLCTVVGLLTEKVNKVSQDQAVAAIQREQLGKDIARMDGSLEYMRKDLKETTDNMGDALGQLVAVWRTLEDLKLKPKRASDVDS